MTARPSLETAVMESLGFRLTGLFPSQIRQCLEQLSDEQLWWRPNDTSNSVGNLVLHLSGSLRHYVCRGLGGLDYTRDRPAEFTERGPVPKPDLIASWDETTDLVRKTLDGLDIARLTEPSDDPSYNPTNFDVLFNAAVHISSHAGQIVFITKMLQEGSVDEMWIKTHKSLKKAGE